MILKANCTICTKLCSVEIEGDSFNIHDMEDVDFRCDFCKGYFQYQVKGVPRQRLIKNKKFNELHML